MDTSRDRGRKPQLRSFPKCLSTQSLFFETAQQLCSQGTCQQQGAAMLPVNVTKDRGTTVTTPSVTNRSEVSTPPLSSPSPRHLPCLPCLHHVKNVGSPTHTMFQPVSTVPPSPPSGMGSPLSHQLCPGMVGGLEGLPLLPLSPEAVPGGMA